VVVSVLQKTNEDESAKWSYCMVSTSIMKGFVAGRTCVAT
jgi:hypothetical protein